MKEVKIHILAALMGLGILASSVIPFVYWFRNPHLSHLKVFNEVWHLHFGGILLVFLTIALAGDDKKGRVPKMRNPPPPPCKHNWFVKNDIQKRTLEVRCYECDVVNIVEENRLFDEYSNYVYELTKRNLPALPISQWVMEIKFKDA